MPTSIGADARQLIEAMAAEAGPGRLFVLTPESGPYPCVGADQALRLAEASDQARIWIGTAQDLEAWFHFKWDLPFPCQIFDVGGDEALIDKVSVVR